MLVAVFGDAHAHAEALETVIAAAHAARAEELWSLGDMVGGGPDPQRVVELTREHCTVALLGNHDYGATGSVEPERAAGPEGARSIELAREQLAAEDIDWMRSRKPAARRHGVQCWHGSPRNPVWEFVGPGNAAACLDAQRLDLGLVGHTHVAEGWLHTGRRPRRHTPVPGEPLDLNEGKWLLNPGAACDGSWLLLDLAARSATWQLAASSPPGTAAAAARWRPR